MVVLGALGAVLLGVGAFSFLGGGSPAPKPTPTVAKKDGTTGDASKEVKVDDQGNPIPGTGEETEPAPNPLYAADLPQRDPFVTRALPGEKLQTPQATLPPPSQPVKRPSGGGRRSAPNFDPGGYRPVPLEGSLPGAGGSQVTLNPTGPDPSTPGYSLSGTLNGARKIAVFTDSQGNQRMVPEGGSLDGDSKVVSIEKGSVTIESRGKKQRLSLGGNPK